MDPVSDKPQVITVSTTTLVKVVIFGLALAFLFVIRDIILLFFVSLIMASIINPLAAWFQTKRLSRGLAVILLYVLILGLIALIVGSLVPAVVHQIQSLKGEADSIWGQFVSALGPLRAILSEPGAEFSFSAYLQEAGAGTAAGNILTTVRDFFGGIVSMIIVFVVTFYLVVSEDALKKLFRTVAPEPYQPYLVDLFMRIEKAIGSWVRAQLILSLIIFTAVYLVLTILGVKYALILALAAGLAEFIPYVGATIAAIPAVIIAFTQSPLKGLLVALAYIVIQQTENHILVPKVMQKTVGLHPIVSIFSLLIGAKVAGLVGALLAIPTATALSIVAEDLFRQIKTHK